MDGVGKLALGCLNSFCTAVRKLVMEMCQSVICWESPGFLEDWLCAAGPILATLEIYADPVLHEREFKQLQELCRNLSSITLRACTEESESACADLLCSYGSLLQYADLGWMPVPLCERITKSFENMHCELSNYVPMPLHKSLAKITVQYPK